MRLKGRKALSSWWKVSKSCVHADADRGTVVAVAPGHVVAVLQPRHPRIVGVLEAALDLADAAVGGHERDRLGVDVASPRRRRCARRGGSSSASVSSTRKTPAKPSPKGTTAELKMLFERGSRSRRMIGLRDDRQIDAAGPAGRSSHGIGACPERESRACGRPGRRHRMISFHARAPSGRERRGGAAGARGSRPERATAPSNRPLSRTRRSCVAKSTWTMPKRWAVALGPLEVVEQRPGEVAAQRHAPLDRVEARPRGDGEVADARRVARRVGRVDGDRLPRSR